MSAVAQNRHFYGNARFQELDATREISSLASRAAEGLSGVESVARAILRLEGIRAVEFQGVRYSKELDQDRELGPHGFAIANVIFSGSKWGELRIEFDLPFDIGSPVRFVNYAAQQIGGMLKRIELRAQKRALEQLLSKLQQTLETRKTVQRAAGILARAYELTEKDSIALLFQQSRQLSRPVRRIAEHIIASHTAGPALTVRKAG